MFFVTAFVLGAVIGSFLNVCIIRIPKGESIFFPASHCVSCHKRIAWSDNIPILSFIFLKGRCRQCSAKISWQYIGVEFLTACVFVLCYGVFGLTVKGILYLILSLALLTESFIDLKHQIIPDVITLPGIVIGLIASTVFPLLHGQDSFLFGFLRSLGGVLLGGGFLYLAGAVAEWILKKEAMGGGDVKLLAMIGSLIGWQGVLWTIFVSSLLGSIVGIYCRLSRGQEKIPFGPYLAMAAFLYLFLGERVMQTYFQSIGF